MLVHKWDTVCKRQRGWTIHAMIQRPHLLSERQLISGTWVLVCPVRSRCHHGWRVPTQVGGLHIFWELVRRMVIPALNGQVRGNGWWPSVPIVPVYTDQTSPGYDPPWDTMPWTPWWPTNWNSELLMERSCIPLGYVGCSKKEATGREQFCFINVVRNIWRRMSRLSPSTSSCSNVVRVGSPHTGLPICRAQALAH